VVDRNLAFGLSLSVFGSLFSLGSHMVLGNVPLTALGIGLTILGAAWAITPPKPLPKGVVASLVKSSCSNIEALLEALGAFEKAVYIPVEPGGRVAAYVPLKRAGQATLSQAAESAGKIIFRRGGSLGVFVTPPRVELGNPHPVSESILDGLLDYALVESEIASSARAVQSGDSVVVEVRGLRLDVNHSRFKAVMGSFPACVAAQAVAAALSQPVQIADEKREGDRLTVHLRVLDWTDTSYT
jgi:hypothetical protein